MTTNVQNVERDPFLTGADYAEAGKASYHTTAGPRAMGSKLPKHLESVAALVFVPWLCFVAIVVVFALPPPGWFWRLVAVSVWLLCLAFAGMNYAVYASNKGPVYTLFLSLLVLLSCVTAPLAGQKVVETSMSGFWMHKTGVAYKNVVPSRPADAYQDANIIGFSAMSRLDLRQVLGYRPQGAGNTFCVAPVMDARAPTKEINFWATGMDCCEPTRSFLCGEATKASARTGIVVPANTSSYALERWEYFRKAARSAAELYGLEVPDRPIFVRWHEDAEAVQANSLHTGIVEVILMSFLDLMVSLFLAAWLHWSTAMQLGAIK